MAPVPNDILAVLRRAGLLDFGDEPTGEPLTGGVSSDIWRVDLPLGSGLRQAGAGPAPGQGGLARAGRAQRLRGRLDADRARRSCRRRRRSCCSRIGPRVPWSCATSRRTDYRLWKDRAAGRRGRSRDCRSGRRAAGRDPCRDRRACRDRGAFPTDAIFHDIRLEPYLIATAGAHPPLAPALRRLARRTATTKLALVHGDVSPKNIMVGPDGPVFLDAECAWYGDPAFDLAFCLNHLLLKCLWMPAAAPGFLDCFDSLAAELSRGRQLGAARRSSRPGPPALLPGLFLARIDGKSPVEYVTDMLDKERVRRVAGAFLLAPSETLASLREAWAVELGAMSADCDPTGDRAPGLGQPRPADGRGRAASSRAGRSAAPSPRPAPRPAAARRSTCATAARRSAAWTSRARSPT